MSAAVGKKEAASPKDVSGRHLYLPDPKRSPRESFENAGWDKWLKTHPLVPWFLYVPCAFWLSLEAGRAGRPNGLLFGAGLMLWTLLEYWIHRIPLHADLEARWTLGVARIHWNHHQHPEDVTQVIMSPAQNLPLAGIVFLLVRAVLPLKAAMGTMSGILVGYVGYETFHYIFHAPIKLPFAWMNALRKNHAVHHYDDPDARYGVTTTLWDYVFRSR